MREVEVIVDGSNRKKRARKRSNDSRVGQNGADDTQLLYARNQGALALLFGVSVPLVGRWISEGAPPKRSRGYDLREWIAWVVERKARSFAREAAAQATKAQHEQAAADCGGPVATNVDERLKTRRCELLELEAQKRRRELMPRTQHEQACLARTRFFAHALDALASTLMGKMLGKRPQDQRAIVEEEVAALKTQMVSMAEGMT